MYKNKYTGPVVSYSDSCDEGGMLSAADMSLKDSMIVSVFGNEERVLLTARYDNLGKGASGAAVELLNMITGAKITEGLDI